MQTGWFQSIENKQSVNAANQPVPWITYPACHFIDGKDLKGVNLFEYGSGNSSLYFTGKGANVYSVEHDQGWYERIKSKIPLPERLYYRGIETKDQISGYINAVSAPGVRFGIIVVDGRFRRRCLLEAPGLLSTDGVIILDNSERHYYREGINFLLEKGFRKIDFFGIAPIGYSMSCTTIFYRDNNILSI